MCEGCTCNLPAKVSFCIGTALVVVGSIVYAIGGVQSAEAASQSMIVDGKRTFTLDISASGNYARGYSFFRDDWSNCQEHSDEVRNTLASLGYDTGYMEVCGWGRGTHNYGGQELVSIGHFTPTQASGATASFNLNYWTWVVDASVDLEAASDALALAGLSLAGFAVASIGSIMCCVGCCLMCCVPDNKTTVVQQVPVQQGPGTAMVVGQPVMDKPVMAQPV